ncbi:MAG: hypothetical protein ACE149_04605 [Armatimonadota bacterium]
MARGRAKRGGRAKVTRDYYDRLPSDAEYQRIAHQRASRSALNAWLIRLVILLALAGAVYLWGDDLMGLIRGQAQETRASFQRVGGTIKEGRDRRSGADWVER